MPCNFKGAGGGVDATTVAGETMLSGSGETEAGMAETVSVAGVGSVTTSAGSVLGMEELGGSAAREARSV